MLIVILLYQSNPYLITGDEDLNGKTRNHRTFCGDVDDWSAYTETLEQYFVANDVTKNAKNKRFCSVLVER